MNHRHQSPISALHRCRTLPVTLLLAVLLSLTSAAFAEGDVLSLALDAFDVSSLNPSHASEIQDRVILDMIFNGLWRYVPGDASTLELDLAEAYELSEDGRRLTVEIKKGVWFHPFAGYPDGHELTAEDVAFSINQAADPGASIYAGDMSIFSATAVDRYTVHIDMARPTSLYKHLLSNYSGGFIVSKSAFETLGGDAELQPVGTGPFAYKGRIPGKKVMLERNERYFRGQPKLQGVDVLFIPDPNARVAALERKEIDAMEGVPEQDWIDEMQSAPGVDVEILGPGSTGVLHFNLTREPFVDKRVRMAVAHALDPDEIAGLLGADLSRAIYGPIPAPFPGTLTPADVAARGLDYETDIDRAKALLATAGYPDGLDVTLAMSPRGEYLVPMRLIQSQLRRAGIRLELQLVDHSTYHSLIRNDESPLVLYVAGRPDANTILTQFFHSDSIVRVGKRPATNFSHFAGADRLIEAAREENDGDKQAELWRQAQFEILDALAAYPIYVLDTVWARSDRVDWGHPVKSSLNLYPQVTEETRIEGRTD